MKRVGIPVLVAVLTGCGLILPLDAKRPRDASVTSDAPFDAVVDASRDAARDATADGPSPTDGHVTPPDAGCAPRTVPDTCATPDVDDDCDGEVDEDTDVQTNPAYCGSCADSCASSQACEDGVCVPNRLAELSAGAHHTCARTLRGDVHCWGSNDEGQLDGVGASFENDPSPAGPVNARWASALVSGTNHNCVLTHGTREIWCWGVSKEGQTGHGGDPSVGTTTEPRRVPVEGRFVALEAANRQTCAIEDSGALWCWGEAERAIFDGITAMGGTFAPTELELSEPIAAIALGASHACFITRAGTLKCWGENARGEAAPLAAGTPISRRDPNTISPPAGCDEGFVSVDVGPHGTCALDACGRAWCWGFPLGAIPGGPSDPTTGLTRVGGDTSEYSLLAVGTKGACGLPLRASASLECWGENALGALGLGRPEEQPSALLPFDTGAGAVEAVAFGAEHVCAIAPGGRAILCAGSNLEGELGRGSEARYRRPTRVDETLPRAMRTLGAETTCGVDDTTQVQCWGSNRASMLGREPPIGIAENPGLLFGVSNPSSIALGVAHGCTIGGDGRLRCWGANEHGQAGQPPRLSVSTPTVAPGTGCAAVSETFARVATGERHTCVAAGTTVLCFGANERGQLARTGAAAGHCMAPIQREAGVDLANVGALAAGAGHTCAINGTGALVCWGANDHGQLGRGPGGASGIAARVSGIVADELAVGSNHTCVLTRLVDRRLFCFGDNTARQLGQATRDELSIADPAEVSPPAGLVWGDSIAAGSRHTCALESNGRLYCWGANAEGQLGLGHRSVFEEGLREVVPPLGEAEWAAVWAAGARTCANAKSAGGATSLYCWGDDFEGPAGRGVRGYDGALRDTLPLPGLEAP